MRYNARDFDIEALGGWSFFSTWMNKFYVGSPWHFGYKCPQCDKENYYINGNSQIEGNCPACNSSLVPFFNMDRAKKLFTKGNFIGKSVHTDTGAPVGWVLGFVENLKDYNSLLENLEVYNISYICVLPEFRSNGLVDDLRKLLVYLFITRNSLRKILNNKRLIKFMLNSPIILGYSHILEEVRSRKIKAMTAKIHRNASKLEKIAGMLGFKKVAPWKEDEEKFIWIKKI